MKLKEFVVFIGMMFLCVGVAVAGISFIEPTPINNSRIYVNYTDINVSIPVEDLTNFTFNWNGTNTTYLNDSCVLHLSFNNNSEIGDSSTVVRDVSQYSNNGSFVNGSTGTWTSDGKWNGAMTFDGVDDYVDCGNDPSLNITEAITISAWINGTSWVGDSRNIISSRSGVCENYCFRINSAGYTEFTFSNGGWFGLLDTTTPLSVETWRGVAVTYDRQNVRLYVGGVEINSAGETTAMFTNNHPKVVGARPGGGDDSFTGLIDEVRIYNRALTPEEIRQSYLSNLRKFNETQWYFETNQTDLEDGEYNYQAFANNDTTSYNTDYNILTAILKPRISIHSKYPDTLYTNYTGFLSTSYMVESGSLNMSSLAFLMGTNYTTYVLGSAVSDYHSYLKVPPNSIADDGIYRAHNRNKTPLMHWESNDTITEGNVWKWAGGTNDDFWITNESINATHTFVNITGRASNVFPSAFYLGREAMYESEKTGIEINKGQGVIIKVWDLEQFRGRSDDYWVNLFFDTQMEAGTTHDIDIWYCNGSFNPNIDDPVNCEFCERMDTWTDDRWMNHSNWQPHNNVSYARPLTAYAGEPATIPPDEVDYVYFTSETVSSKSFILNATNDDPAICNLTFAETQTMWLRDEVAGTNTQHAYTPSFFITFVRDFLEFTHHLYIANDQGMWGHSDYITHPIGISNINPTHCKFNYYWWNGTTDYDMNGTYSEDFSINLTYGVDPDNGASLTHVLSLYDNDYNFIAFINDSLIGNATDVDIAFDAGNYINKYYSGSYRFKIVSTDNEASTSVTWSNEFYISRDSWFKNTVSILSGFPAAVGGILTSFLSFLPLFVGILISGFLILVCVGVFGKLKRW